MHRGGRTRYLLHHPGFTGSLRQPAKTIIQLLAKVVAQPIGKSIQPIIELTDDPTGRGAGRGSGTVSRFADPYVVGV
ncbi:hypothetical protein AB0L53_27080 [Nonomuraea sp. NPDC052129]|uniref:hypothetical protein n=1 Tax=Nonomuraea sp. NPDC052129 TaxID=3154651 RepID=UPI0034446774